MKIAAPGFRVTALRQFDQTYNGRSRGMFGPVADRSSSLTLFNLV
jgi:hypothetical protein